MGYVYSQLVKAQLENLASDPASNPDGLVYLNTTSNVVKWYANSSWRTAVDTDTVQSLSGKTFTDDVVFSSTGAITVPVGTDAQLPGAPTVGMIRYNTDNAEFEGYADGAWGGIGGGGLVPVVASAAVNPAEAGSHYLTNSTVGGFTITLPASPELGDVIRVSDSEDGWGANNVTVNGNGKNINADATLVLDVTGQWVQFMYDGAKWVTDDPIDGGLPGGGAGGTGSGGINYIVNSDFEEDVANWVVSGLPTISIESGAPLRDNQSMKISLTAADQSNADYVQSDAFGLDAADNNRILKLSFDFQTSAAYVAGDMEVVIWDETGSVVILPSQTSLPQGNGTFEATFVTTASTSYRLRIRGTASGTTAAARDIVIDNVKVGPETAFSAAPVGDWESFTPAFASGHVPPTFSVSDGKSRRVGDSLEVQLNFYVSAGSADVNDLTLKLPYGLTADETKIPLGGAYGPIIGYYFVRDQTGSPSVMSGNAMWNTSVQGIKITNTSNDTFWPYNQLNNANNQISINYSVPIAEWSGSGVSLSAARVCYSSNFATNTSGSDDTSFAYGIGGSPVPASALAGNIKRRVRFQTPIQPSDVLTLEIARNDGTPSWAAIGNVQTGITGTISGAVYDYGMGIEHIPGEVDDVYVFFARYRRPQGTWDAPGADWGGGWLWRVRKSSPNAPAGIQLATDTVPGLLVKPVRFFASGPGGVAINTISITIPYSSTSVNVGSHFSTGTNTFTAPYDGLYYFSIGCLISGSFCVNLHVYVNGSDTYMEQRPTAPSGTSSVATSGAIYLNAGDTVVARATATGAGSIGTNSYNYFSGYFVG